MKSEIYNRYIKESFYNTSSRKYTSNSTLAAIDLYLNQGDLKG